MTSVSEKLVEFTFTLLFTDFICLRVSGSITGV